MLVSVALALLSLATTVTQASPVEKRWARVRIRSGRDGKCLTAAPKTGVGYPVYTGDCGSALLWSISPGAGSIHLGPLALDAGEKPHNNGQLKVWTSYPGLMQQTWYLTNDNRIAIMGGDQCLDEGNNGVQTYQCTPNNDNQGETSLGSAKHSLVHRRRERSGSYLGDSNIFCLGLLHTVTLLHAVSQRPTA